MPAFSIGSGGGRRPELLFSRIGSATPRAAAVRHQPGSVSSIHVPRIHIVARHPGTHQPKAKDNKMKIMTRITTRKLAVAAVMLALAGVAAAITRKRAVR